MSFILLYEKLRYSVLDDINFQLEYHLKDRNHVEIFTISPSAMFERDYNLKINEKILLEKYKKMIQ